MIWILLGCFTGWAAAKLLHEVECRVWNRRALKYICEHPDCLIENIPVPYPSLTVRELRSRNLVRDDYPRMRATATALGHLKNA